MTLEELTKLPPVKSVTPKKTSGLTLDELSNIPSSVSPVAPTSPNFFETIGKRASDIVVPSAIRKGLEFVGAPAAELASGALKGAGSTGFGIAKVGEKIADITGLNTALKFIGEKLGVGSLEARVGEKPKALETKTTAEEIGFGAEQLGEFFIPVGGGAKAVSTIEKIAPKASKIARIGAEAIGEGAEYFTKSAAQTGDLEAAAESGAISAAIPPVISVAGKATAPLKKYLSEKIAPRAINSLIKPVAKEFSFGRNPGAGIAAEGIVANTRQGLLDAVTAKKKEVGQEIGNLLKGKTAANKIIDVEPLLAPIDEAITSAAGRGEQGLVNRLTNLRNGLTTEFETITTRTAAGTKEVRAVPRRQRNLQMTPEDARKFKTELGEATRWHGLPFDGELNQVKVAVYRKLDDALDVAVPGIDALNQRYANLLSAEKSVEREAILKERQNLIGLIPAGVGAAVGVGSAVASGDLSIEDAFLAGAAALGVKGLSSPAVKTRVGAALGKLKPEEQQFLTNSLDLIRNLLLSSGVLQGDQK